MTQEFYRAFEDKYRGSRELIKSRLRIYLPFVSSLRYLGAELHAIDLGCGRGEWLEILQEAGFVARGVDLDDGMLNACKALGLDAVHQDAVSALQALPDQSQAIVSGFHLAEHVPFTVLQTLLKEALRVLKPAGLMILETPNPENIVVAANNFYLDPTHEKPLPRQLLGFLAEHTGFARTQLLRLQEPRQLTDGQRVGVMDVLAGVSPDYAIVAQKAADEESMAATGAPFEADHGISLDAVGGRFDQQTDADLAQMAARLDSLASERALGEERIATNLREAETRYAEQFAAIFRNTEAALATIGQSVSDVEQSNHAQLQRLDVLDAGTANRLARLEQAMHALHLKEQSRLSNRLRAFVRRKVVAAAGSSWSAPAAKDWLSGYLREHAPGLHSRLKALRPQRNLSMTQLQAEPMEVEATHLPSTLHPVLSDPNLITIERPAEIYLNPESLHWAASSETLEPVVELNQMRQSEGSVCFVVSLAGDNPSTLERTLQSVLRQTDPSWEVLICCCENEAARLSAWLDVDWRVRRFIDEDGSSEVRRLQRAAMQATTHFIGLLSQGDVIDDDLVKLLGEKVRHASSDLDLIYTDEARQIDSDRVGGAFYKPDWSPEHQQSVNMVGRFAAIRKSLLLGLEAPDASNASAAEYQLLLEATRRARGVAHIDDLAYFRSDTGSTAVGGFFAADALEEARQALERHVRRESRSASVIANAQTGSLRVHWPSPAVAVTLVILTGMYEKELPGRGKVNLAANFVRSIISKSTYANYKILVVDDGVMPADLGDLLKQHGHEWVSYPKKPQFSFADKANFGTAQVRDGIVVLLNDDLEVISPDWIQALASEAARPEIGVVGGKLQFPDGTIQHAGITLGFHGSAGHIFHRANSDGREYGGFASITRNYSAVTGAVMAYRKNVFDAVGGFDLQFSTDYNDLDFCLKCIEAGYRVVYTPEANLFHFHNSSLKRTHDKDVERKAFLTKWAPLVARDPFYSKHFQKESQDRPLVGE